MDSSSKLKRKTIYSPVNAQSFDAPIERHPTLAKLRYLDETTTTTDEDELSANERNQKQRNQLNSRNNHQEYYQADDQRKRRVLPPFEKCSPKTTRAVTTKQPIGRTFQDNLEPNQGDEFDQSIESFDGNHHHDLNEVRETVLDESCEINDEVRGEPASYLEEVYLCNCCGVTRQLDPAMKFMPMFRNQFLFTNFLVFALGLASLGMGLWFRIDPKVYEIHKYIETQNFTLAGWIMLFAGLTACLMSLVAFCSISKQPVCLLTFYSIIMTLLTILSIGSLVLLTVYGLGSSLERFLNKEIYEQIRRRTMSTEVDLSSSSDAAQFLDFVQVKLRCCGAQDFRDYQKLGMIIPTTCYTIAENYINAPGCGHALRRLFDIRAGMATGFVTGAIVVQLVAVVLASLMICSIYNWRATSRPASAASYATRSPVNG